MHSLFPLTGNFPNPAAPNSRSALFDSCLRGRNYAAATTRPQLRGRNYAVAAAMLCLIKREIGAFDRIFDGRLFTMFGDTDAN